MQGKKFRPFWRARGFSNKEIEGFVKVLDKDIHGAISAAPPGGKPWWDESLIGRILAQESKKKGQKLTKSEVMREVNNLLDKLTEFSPH